MTFPQRRGRGRSLRVGNGATISLRLLKPMSRQAGHQGRFPELGVSHQPAGENPNGHSVWFIAYIELISGLADKMACVRPMRPVTATPTI